MEHLYDLNFLYDQRSFPWKSLLITQYQYRCLCSIISFWHSVQLFEIFISSLFPDFFSEIQLLLSPFSSLTFLFSAPYGNFHSCFVHIFPGLLQIKWLKERYGKGKREGGGEEREGEISGERWRVVYETTNILVKRWVLKTMIGGELK